MQYQFKGESAAFILALAHELDRCDCKWFASVLLRNHPGAFAQIDDAVVGNLACGIADRSLADSFAWVLVGPAWLKHRVSDGLVQGWANSADPWQRRIALVSTVALNSRSSDGGLGGTARTLMICPQLAAERSELVVPPLRWALNALAATDPAAVHGFLDEYAGRLAPMEI
ncbi:MAG: DNA alkylation repair protein [Anaerolineae bacterium]